MSAIHNQVNILLQIFLCFSDSMALAFMRPKSLQQVAVAKSESDPQPSETFNTSLCETDDAGTKKEFFDNIKLQQEFAR